MATPVNIRANVRVPFPALVQGVFPVSIAKANGIWSISVDITGLANIIASQLGGIPPQYRATTLTPITVQTSPSLDTYIGVDTAAIAGPWQVNLVTAVSRQGFPLWFKDISGSARTYNGTFNPAGTDLIETVGGPQVLMNIDRQVIGLLPVTQGTGSPGWIRID